MLAEEKQRLLHSFSDRVAFHDIERMLYSRDLGNLTHFVKKKMNPIPDAVLQPDSIHDLRTLIDLVAQYKTPIVPRGAGTAGYGGAVPARGGITIDFHRLCRVIEVDRSNKTATLESGVVWQNLEKELHRHGLALCLYPGSAMSSTVGGWLANGGGVGIGSFEYGRMINCVLEADLITPKGTRSLKGEDLYLVDGMAGTTGLISQVTLRVREEDKDVPILGTFNNLDDLSGLLKEIREQELALWHVHFRDPLHVKLSREAMERQADKTSQQSRPASPRLPEDRILATFAYPQRKHGQIADRLSQLIEGHNGEILDGELAAYEWAERFYPRRLKALGPSLVQTEVLVSGENLPELRKGIDRRIEGVSMNGIFTDHGREAVVMTYALFDERCRDAEEAYQPSLITLEEAEKLGAGAYAMGVHLNAAAERVLGKQRLSKIRAFKEDVDPDDIINPGKVFASSPDNGADHKTNSQAIAPDAKAFDKENVLWETLYGKQAEWDAFACDGCGYCRSECPLFNAIGWESASPRGKFHFLRGYLKGSAKSDERMAEMFFVCTNCHKCAHICQIKAHIEEDWTLAVRPALLQEGFRPPLIFQRQAFNIVSHHNPGGFPQNKRKAWVPSNLKIKEDGEIGYWAGCAASFTYLLRNIPINAVRILNKAGIEPVYLGSDEWCCGGALFSLGAIHEVVKKAEHNINELNRKGIKTLIISCAGGWKYLTSYYPLFARQLNLKYDIRIRHITEVIDELIDEGAIKFEKPVELKVTYHDPCQIGPGGGILDPPRKIMGAIPGLRLLEMPRNRERSACCGKHAMRYPHLGSAINLSRVAEAGETGASVLVTCCTTCENNFRIGISDAGSPLEVLDLMDLAAESMGLPRLSVSKIGKLLRK